MGERVVQKMRQSGAPAALEEEDSESDGGVVLELEEAIDVEDAVVWESLGQGKGKGKMVDEPMVEEEPVKPFLLLNLPTEIRLEIYKYCLVRPGPVLLSRVEKPLAPVKQTIDEAEDDVEDDDATASTASASPATRHHTTRSSQSGRLRVRSGHTTASRIIQPTPNTPETAVRPAPLSKPDPPKDTRPRMANPFIINILRTSKAVYKEARDVLYGENDFTLNLRTAVASLAALHQRSRGRIRHIECEIGTYSEILESFSETVRLSLRYCSGLRTLVVHTPFSLPGADGNGSSGNTTVYANGFDILRWLPRGCEVVLKGVKNPEIDAVVERHRGLARTQDKVRYNAPWLRTGRWVPDEPISSEEWEEVLAATMSDRLCRKLSPRRGLA